MSRLGTTVAEVDSALSDYHPTRATRAVERFVDDLSNWYVRRSRRRFWKESAIQGDKETAYQTVFECLDALARLMAPVAPFSAEWLFQNLKAGSVTARLDHLSVHTAPFPTFGADDIDADLERRMDLARTISSCILALRNASGVNVRQPLPRMLVVTGHGTAESDVEAVRQVILDEVNVKRMDFIDSTSGIVSRTARANFKALGRRLGKNMKPAAAAIAALDQDAITRFVEAGEIQIEVAGDTLALREGDLEVVSEGVDGWLVQHADGVTVALDPTVDAELINEGFAREVVNRVQSMRKQANLNVTDRIVVRYRASERLGGAVGKYGDWIRNETLALRLEPAINPGGELVESYRIDDEELTVGIERATATSDRDK
jgi:isoleucyl-tRNA synthetase